MKIVESADGQDDRSIFRGQHRSGLSVVPRARSQAVSSLCFGFSTCLHSIAKYIETSADVIMVNIIAISAYVLA